MAVTAANPLTRRQILRLGCVALGSSFAPGSVGPARGARDFGRRPRARACILLYMDGGPSHIDLWDLKPDAPAEVRGPFRPIATSVPGLRVCEHLPLTAGQMHHVTQVRSVRHEETVHDPAVYQMLTGHKHPSSQGNLTVQPTDFPHLGPAFGRLDRRPAVMPKVIELPETMKMNGRTLPGQNAGMLGATHDPFRVEVSPGGLVKPPEFALSQDVSGDRLGERASLLARLDGHLESLHRRAAVGAFDDFQAQGLRLLSTPSIRTAFDLALEPDAVRATYGRNRHGQSVLLARRLVEAGARFVTVYWGKEMQDWADGLGPRLVNNPWDTHRNHFPVLKDDLLPRADRALAALLADLHQRGLLAETLVVWMGDFGRTPRIDRKYASRDHWPRANTVLMAGGGLPAGGVYGRTDGAAAEVTADPVSPADIAATVFTLMGVEPRSTVRDVQGRPFTLSEGTAVPDLLT